MNITLPSLRCLEPKVQIKKLCGGDLYRATAPVLSRKEQREADRGYERIVKKISRDQRAYNPRHWVGWSQQAIDTMFDLKNRGLTAPQIADELNRLFPQTSGVFFTKNSVLGKIHRLRNKQT